MNYIVFDQDGEMLDVLDFNLNELALFKTENPTYIVKEEDDFVYDEDDFYDEDDEAVW